ncbi:Cystathionine gamma-synthase [Exophiala xenobiotica]|nr:Cystathionine gamma-synthase [Exophiala xenobiotica]KAK5216189.1 Cystathionine gamma-synthase [Exophiala xenobiotica]KAK5285625.1 Cystathionine gamma-synthase [Exophiala xenobiotica]KAK5446168.1 Cystathionine gamma-synthase [Exophiala xenobiotica]KAK5497197.1 Cystathionine gamma-synthase [Exophiala xenobiotica]
MLAALGQPVPNTDHAVSVSLPSWKATVGYEEGEDWVVSKMRTGYPRFFIHLTIQELEKEVLKLYGRHGEKVMLFPSLATAKRCQKFFYDKVEGFGTGVAHILQLEPVLNHKKSHETAFSSLFCVFFPKDYFSVAKQVWQHSGDGISSRRGEFCLKALKEGFLQLVASPSAKPRHEDVYSKGPRRYQKASQNGIIHNASPVTDSPRAENAAASESQEKDHAQQFVEERFGRNLNIKLASQAKLAIRRRISGSLTGTSELEQTLAVSPDDSKKRQQGLSEDDVYLYPTGMSSIFNTHRILMANAEARGRELRKSICFGFPYVDTLKILEKWGPGCHFYGLGSSACLDDLERRLESGERFLALFSEFPSNPLLNSPDLLRIRKLADKYDFAVVIDETVGNFTNIDVLRHSDVVVSSLTKVFSGDSNVMGGSAVLNPASKWYTEIKQTLDREYEDNYWAEDAVFMERNSRDFISRSERINGNAEAIASRLQSCPFVKKVYYPKCSPSRPNYDACRTANGGYGGLLSVTFQHYEQAIVFFDTLECQKGPSLGTNFTLACPFTILAHYTELDWTAKWGVEPDLVRLSVGLEDPEDLTARFDRALKAAESAKI